MNKIRTIAVYLPQFHPVPENDIWWGKGFTEWTNVVKSKPRFEGHYQPQLPADLGYYDLRLPEARQAQADLAKFYGVDGFCYYHYWFNGRLILERPLKEVFESGKPDFPFMICWANENWTKIWDGGNNDVLLEQKYSREDDVAHIKYLIPYFKDKRYIKVNDKPVFVIYKDALIPDINQTIKTFRAECAKQNIELYLCKFDRENGTVDLSDDNSNFDAAVEFQPLSRSLREFKKQINLSKDSDRHQLPKYLDPNRYLRFAKRLLGMSKENCEMVYNTDIIPYKEFIEFDLKYSQKNKKLKLYPCVSPGFDNSSRRKEGLWAQIFHGSTPDLFKIWIEGKLEKYKPFNNEENFFFINAWNEWAEGNHLEPDEKWGVRYLEALKDAFRNN
jgi:hypothetical protein